MKKAVVGILNRVPVVLIVIGEALVIYLATAVEMCIRDRAEIMRAVRSHTSNPASTSA